MEEEIIDRNKGKRNEEEKTLRQILSDNKAFLKEIEEFVEKERGRNCN
jgi:hypothetical protein